MSIESTLRSRSGSICELCSATDGLTVHELPGGPGGEDSALMACATCAGQLAAPETVDANHWRCLNDSMWSTVPAVQVVAWQMLNRLKGEGWPADLIDMMYMEEETRNWAESLVEKDGKAKHIDAHGNVLSSGDTVTIIKSLDVKGSSLTAKRGTSVRNIRIVHDNPEHIEGKVEGQNVVILTKFVKKS